MDQGLCVSEEQRVSINDSDRDLLSVEFRDLNLENANEFYDFLGLYWEFNFKVTGEDLNFEIEYPIGPNENIKTTALEAEYLGFVKLGGQVQVAVAQGEIVGFMLYHRVFDCILIIRGMYTAPKYYCKRIGYRLINSIEGINLILFQTRNEKPPAQMLKMTERYRRLVGEDEKLKTWQMRWEVR